MVRERRSAHQDRLLASLLSKAGCRNSVLRRLSLEFEAALLERISFPE
jgi:hypothetical protein